jgi:hypothetical protein
MDEVQVAALDRGLGLELAPSASRLGKDRRTVTDHREGTARAIELLDDRVPDGLAGLGPLEGACLVGIPLDRVGRGGDRRWQLLCAELSAPHGVDATDRALERLVDPRRQLAHARTEVLDFTGASHDPASPAQHDEDTECQRGEGRDWQEDRELTHAQQAP